MRMRTAATVLALVFVNIVNAQINSSQIKTSVKKTIVNSDDSYLPKGCILDSTNSYALHYDDRAVLNLNTSASEWVISNSNTWHPVFWDRRWGTRAKSIDKINEETILSFDYKATDHKIDAIKSVVELSIKAESPGARELFGKKIFLFGVNEIVAEGHYDIFYDLNNDNISDINVHISADYRDTILDGYNTLNGNCDLNYSERTMRPFNCTPAFAIRRNAKVATYSIEVKFYQNKPLFFSFLPSQSSLGCFMHFNKYFTPTFNFNGRYVLGKWEIGCDHMSFAPKIEFSPIQENFYFIMDDDLFDTCAFHMNCVVGGKSYRSFFSLLPYYEAGYTGCPSFSLDSTYITIEGGVKTLSITGTIDNIDANEDIAGSVNDKPCQINSRLGKKVKRSKTVKIDVPLTDEPTNLKLVFEINEDPLPEFIVTGTYQQDLLDHLAPNNTIEHETATIKWLNPSSLTATSDVPEFSLVARIYTTEEIKSVAIVPIDNSKLTVEYQTRDSLSWSSLNGEGYVDVYAFVKLQTNMNKLKLLVTFNSGNVVESRQVQIDYRRNHFLQPPDSTRNLFVISVGINQYRDNSFRDLRFASKDAWQIDSAFGRQELLPSGQRLWDNVYTTLLTDSQATTNGILKAIRELECEANDVIVFFFSGHGKPMYDPVTGKSAFCMITHDCIANSAELTGITYDRLLSEINQKGCNSVILLDACFSGTALNSKAAEVDIKTAIQENMVSTGYINPSCLTISSCSSNELAADDTGLQNGILARTLLMAFGNKELPHSSAGRDTLSPDFIRKNEILDTDELSFYCRDGVFYLSSRKQKSGSSRRNSYDPINLFVLPTKK